MKYKVGDKFNVIIPGFSPTTAKIDNIKEKNGEVFYYISFQEERLFTICRVVTEEYLDSIINSYDENKDNLEPFMMLNGDESGSVKDRISKGERVLDDVINKDIDIKMESKVDFTMKPSSMDFK